MDISGVTNGWKLGMDAGDSKQDQSKGKGDFAGMLASLGQKRADEAKNGGFKPASNTPSDAAQEFKNYMQKSPAERFQEQWLKAHGYTKAQFDALPPEKKQALLDEMRKELEDQIKRTAEDNAKTGSNKIGIPAII